MKPATMAKSKQEQPSFEEGLGRLEQIVKQLENGDLPLKQSISLFEEGMELSEACRKQLKDAEAKVEILVAKDDQDVDDESKDVFRGPEEPASFTDDVELPF